MRIRRPWRVVAGAGTAAVFVGLGATAAVAGSDGVELQDRGEPSPIENVQLDQVDSATDGPSNSPFDSVSSTQSPNTPNSPATPDTPNSPNTPASPDSADSPRSADSADSADSAGSAD